MHEVLLPYEKQVFSILQECSGAQCSDEVEQMGLIMTQMDELPSSAIQLARECGRVDRLLTPILATVENRKLRRISSQVKKLRHQIRSSISKHQRSSKQWEYIQWKEPDSSEAELEQRAVGILQEFVLAYLGRTSFPERDSDDWNRDREELLVIVRENGQQRMAEIGVSNAWAHNGPFATYLEALSASVGDAYDLKEEIDRKMRELKYKWEADSPQEKHDLAIANIQSALLEKGLISKIPLPENESPEWEKDKNSLTAFFSGDVWLTFVDLGLAGSCTGNDSAFSTPLDAIATSVGEHYHLANELTERKRFLRYEWVHESIDDSRAQTILTIRYGLLENCLISSHPFPIKGTDAWEKDRTCLLEVLSNVSVYIKRFQNHAFTNHPGFLTYLDALQASIGEHYDLNAFIETKKRPWRRKTSDISEA